MVLQVNINDRDFEFVQTALGYSYAAKDPAGIEEEEEAILH